MTLRAHTVGATSFDPDQFFEDWAKHNFNDSPAARINDLRLSMITAFNLPADDSYVYHAIASVTLSQVQQAVIAGSANGLHAWYRDEQGKPLPAPPSPDIEAYTSIFSSTTSTPKALTGFASNAKEASLRTGVAAHLSATRMLPGSIKIPKLKAPHVNPYLDFWNWSCQNLEWVGPDDEYSLRVRHSHPVLPVFMHHFGCLCPSYEGLEIIKQVAKGRPVLEIGSGNGYWGYLLRRLGLTVTAIDNRQSVYRTLWISDTIITDGMGYLKKHHGAKDHVLLLVYPIVGGDGFTNKILEAYQGDTIVVGGTQNRNGYTGFSDRTIDDYMIEKKPEYEKVVQVALPSFAGKDEALFVFERRRP